MTHCLSAQAIPGYLRLRCPPPKELVPYVDSYLLLENPLGGTLPRLLPGTGAGCIFILGAPLVIRNIHTGYEETWTKSFLQCNRTQVLDLLPTGPVGLMLMNFRPGRLRYFTPVGFFDLQDRITALEDLWGGRANDLTGRLQQAADLVTRADLLSVFLFETLHSEREARLDLALDLLYLTPTLRVAELAEQAGWSLRHFERLFTSTYGVTPKYFARVARMQRVARSLALNPVLSTVDSALDAGFFDQSHFIHELHKLARLSPQELARSVRERPHFYNPRALQWYIAMLNSMLDHADIETKAKAYEQKIEVGPFSPDAFSRLLRERRER